VKNLTLKALLPLIFLSSLTVSTVTKANCAPTGLDAKNQYHLTSWLRGQKQAPAVAVLPFLENTVHRQDEFTSFDLQLWLTDSLFELGMENITHPMAEPWLREKPKFDGWQNLTQLEKIATDHQLSAIIYGAYQRVSDDSIRVWLYAYHHADKIIGALDEPLHLSYNNGLLSGTKQALRDVLKKAEIKTKKYEALETPSWLSQRYYTRGVLDSYTYDISTLNRSQVWLERSVRENLGKITWADFHLIRVLYRKALLTRNEGRDSSHLWQQASDKWQILRQRLNKFEKKYPKLSYLLNRFEEERPLFLLAGQQFGSQNKSLAGETAQNGLSFVPEDIILERIVKELGLQTPQEMTCITNATNENPKTTEPKTKKKK
jgi:hypothetical protein